MTSNIRLSEEIAPTFWDFHRALKHQEYTDYWLKGGRGSAKSSTAAIECCLALKRDPKAHVIVYRRLSNTLGDSVYPTVGWALNTLGIADEFRSIKSPYEYIHKTTGQRIIFRGLDDPLKYKSFNFDFGYAALVWIEEADQIRGLEDIRSIKQTFARNSQGNTQFIYTFNPPKSRDNWANKHVLEASKGKFVHGSTYLDVPPHFLSEQFLEIAEDLKATDELAYRNEYLGEATGTGGNVFENLQVQEITDEQIATFDRIYNGVDFGWFPDPWAFVRCFYHVPKRTIYVFDEAKAVKTGDAETAQIILEHMNYQREQVFTDIQHTSIKYYRDQGINALPAKKGPGSVEASMKWLASRAAIVVDPNRCPNTVKEMSAYEFERDRAGEFVSAYPDKDNHFIDALRYALWQHVERGKS